MPKLSEIQNIKEKDKLAATKVQALWRGYQVRKTPVLTSDRNPADYRLFITSHWPIPSFPTKVEGYFVYLGNSGLYNLALIQEFVKKPILSKDGMTGVPKLFIVDISREVKQFWDLIKKVAANSPDYQAFLKNLKSQEIENQILKMSKHKDETLVKMPAYLDSLMNEKRPEFPAEDWYQFFRQMILKMSVLNGDWGNETIFKAIRGQVDEKIPVIVYGSNILEFVHLSSSVGGCMIEPEKILNNIEILAPTQTIHARTSLDEFKETNNNICPDIVLINPTKAQLNDEKYIPLDSAGYQALNKNLNINLFDFTSTGDRIFVYEIGLNDAKPKPAPVSKPAEDLSWMKRGFLKADPKPETKPASKETGFMGLKKGFLK